MSSSITNKKIINKHVVSFIFKSLNMPQKDRFHARFSACFAVLFLCIGSRISIEIDVNSKIYHRLILYGGIKHGQIGLYEENNFFSNTIKTFFTGVTPVARFAKEDLHLHFKIFQGVTEASKYYCRDKCTLHYYSLCSVHLCLS